MNKEEKEKLINEIVGILHKDAGTMYTKGSCGELGEEYLALSEDYFGDVAESISGLIEAITDPENQPNQFGIDINATYCMPDEVVDKETHEQYLKDIGINK